MNYTAFVANKLATTPPVGVEPNPLPDHLFQHQKDLVSWALKRGRAAIFADTGLGKSRMEILWAKQITEHTKRPCLILAPLAVAQQTTMEGQAVGVDVNLCRVDADVRGGINITNYDRLHLFDPERFGSVVLDESSIIKHHDTKTLRHLLDSFGRTPYRLCATATPAPNDWTELGTHAEFLGICTRQEMLAEYFTHDGGETSIWRLKKHAREIFWRWVVSWGALIRKPSDLGYEDGAYSLPPIHIHEHTADTEGPSNGMLFALEAQTLSERRDARRASLVDRVSDCASIVNADNEPWVVWCDLNVEGDALRSAIHGAVEIRGSDDIDTKERRLADFAAGRIRVLVTKPSIAGFGLNWQHCARMAFVGVTDSFEAYYQAVRRCWRFGQTRDVHVHIFASKLEGAIIANLKRKERDAMAMAESLSAETKSAVVAEIKGAEKLTNQYLPSSKIQIPSFLKAA